MRVVTRLASILSQSHPLRLAGFVTPRAYIPMIGYFNSPDAFATPPPSDVKIVKTSSQKVFDCFRRFLATRGLAMLWLASCDEILSVIFLIMFTTVILSERLFVGTSVIVAVAVDLYFFTSLVNSFKMTFEIVMPCKWCGSAIRHATGIMCLAVTISRLTLKPELREAWAYIIMFSDFTREG